MTNAKEATMRRIAIVLASLPQPVAQRLLGTLQNESQQLVRAALGSLADVDPLERRRALDGFATSLRNDHGKRGPHSATNSSDAAEIIFSRTAMRNLNEREANGSRSGDLTHEDQRAHASGQKPATFAFLRDVDDESLVAHLSGEMPQTLAIILASISPAQAARVLPRLDVKVRIDAMRRMANLKELPAELIDDIGNQLRTRLTPSPQGGGSSGNGAGQRALDAILAELPSEPAPSPGSSLGSSIDQVQNVIDRVNGETIAKETRPVQGSKPRSEVRIAEDTWPDDQSSGNRNESSSTSHRDFVDESSPLRSTDSIHLFLVSMPTDQLRETLGKVPIRLALLTLCGLPNSTAEAVLASLPRKQAKQVREQLATLGSLELREIDEAKQTVATSALSQKASHHRVMAAAA